MLGLLFAGKLPETWVALADGAGPGDDDGSMYYQAHPEQYMQQHQMQMQQHQQMQHQQHMQQHPQMMHHGQMAADWASKPKAVPIEGVGENGGCWRCNAAIPATTVSGAGRVVSGSNRARAERRRREGKLKTPERQDLQRRLSDFFSSRISRARFSRNLREISRSATAQMGS